MNKTAYYFFAFLLMSIFLFAGESTVTGLTMGNNYQSFEVSGMQKSLPKNNLEYSKSTSLTSNQSYPLKINLIDNGGFENIDSNTQLPTGFDYSAYGYANSSTNYTKSPISGTHSGLIEAEGTQMYSDVGNMYNVLNNTVSLNQNLMLSVKLNSTFNYKLSSNKGLSGYISLQFSNGTSYLLNYYFSYGYGVQAYNYTSTKNIMDNQSTTFFTYTRNITADFLHAFGSISNVVLERYINFNVNSPAKNQVNKLIIDDLSLKNKTNNELVSDGGFESAVNYWQSGMAYSKGNISVSHDALAGSNSLKLETLAKPKDSYSQTEFSYNFPAWTVSYTKPLDSSSNLFLNFAWKLHLNASDNNQEAYIDVLVYNQSTPYSLIWYLGSNSPLTLYNYSTQFAFIAPNYNTTNNWNTFSIDINNVFSALHLTDGYIGSYTATIYSNNPSTSEMSLLFDNLSIYSYPLGDAGFENPTHNYGGALSTNGWFDSIGTYPAINITQNDVYDGRYSLNITTTANTNAISHNLNLKIKPNYYSDFHFNLKSISQGAFAYISMSFNTFYTIYYLLGVSGISITNDSTDVYYTVSNFNQLNTWNTIFRNIQNDLNSAFPSISNTWFLTNVGLYTRASGGSHISVLFDDMQFFQDITVPTLNSVSWSSPLYNKPTMITASLSDVYSNIQSAILHYYNSTAWSTESFIHTSGTNYVSTIGKYPYGTNIAFYLTVIDTYGNVINYTNNGQNYKFMIQDNIAPTLQFYGLSSTLVNGSTVNGTVSFFINGYDNGSGIDYGKVKIGNNQSVIHDLPTIISLDTTTQPNGNITIQITLYDKANNSNNYDLILKINNVNNNGLFDQINNFVKQNGIVIGAGLVISLYIVVKVISWRLKKK